MLVSVILSFRNEEANLPELVSRLRSAFAVAIQQGLCADYELVFVDDASEDRSASCLRELGQQKPDLRIVTMARRFGVSECVIAGLRHAHGDVLVTMDADLQDPPELIPSLLEKFLQSKADVVHTVRTRRIGESSLKRGITWLGYRAIRSLSYLDLQVNSGDFKLFSRRVSEHIQAMNEQLPYFRGLVTWVGYRQVSVPYERQARHSGASHFPVLSRRVIDNFLYSALPSFGYGLLKLPLYVGALLVAVGALYGALGVLQAVTSVHWLSWSAMVFCLLALSGLQMVFLGIVGMYLNLVLLQVKNRPLYLVSEVEDYARAGARTEGRKVGASA
jgi:dolichol-phosphate mannosyltransferase